MLKQTGLKLLLVAALTLSVVGCGTDDTDVEVQVLEVIGTWASSWGTDAITAEKWNTATIIKFDNETNMAITQQPADDEYNPSKFSKVVWTEITNESFYYCTVAFGKDTADDATNAEEAADISDLDGEGCGGFSWSKLVPAIEVHGNWATEWGTESVTSHQWNTTTVISYDNKTNTAITQNPEDDEYNPSKFNKLVWTDMTADGIFHYCTVAYGQESAEVAMAAENSSDISDLDGEGCSGFQWTKLNPAEE